MRDGVISEAEQRAYAERVLRDLSLTIDGDPLRLRLVSIEISEDRGDERRTRRDSDSSSMRMCPAAAPTEDSFSKTITRAGLQPILSIAWFRAIRIFGSQRRIEITTQSFYQLDYVQAGVGSGSPVFALVVGDRGWLGAIALLLFTRFVLLSRQRA